MAEWMVDMVVDMRTAALSMSDARREFGRACSESEPPSEKLPESDQTHWRITIANGLCTVVSASSLRSCKRAKL